MLEKSQPGVLDSVNPGCYEVHSSIYSCMNKQHVPRIGNSESRMELIMLWHKRLGHPNFMYLRRYKPELFNGVSHDYLKCETCHLGKQSKGQYPAKNYKESEPFNLVHSDIWGPSRTLNVNGSRWFVIFIDDHTRVTWIYLLKQKSELSQVLKSFIYLIQNQFGVTVKNLRTDNESEYLDREVKSFLAEKGIHHQTANVYTPQQNGTAERKNRHILEVARSIMFSMNVPKFLWGEAVLTATYLINRMPSRVLGFISPREKLLSVFPHCLLLSELPLKTFGCTAYVYLQSQFRGKLDQKSVKCIFLGYSGSQKGYKCFCPQSRKMYTTLNVSFDESSSFYTSNIMCSNEGPGQASYWNVIDIAHTDCTPANTLPTNQSTTENRCEEFDQENMGREDAPEQISTLHQPRIEQVYSRRPSRVSMPMSSDSGMTETTCEPNPSASETDLPIALRKGTRECLKYHRFLSNKGHCCSIYPLHKFVSYDRLNSDFKSFTVSLDTQSVPTSISEALSQKAWKQAVEDEMSALIKNNTWELVTAPENVTPVGCKWVFSLKFNSDGTINRHKARLVARGFTQSYGIDYLETFAPVAKLNTVRIIFSLAINLDWELAQLDIKNAFLNGELKELVYMSIPPGFESSKTKGKLCRLKRSIYGLKQSPRAWFSKFTEVLLSYGFKQAQSDHTLFVHTSGNAVTVLIVYVDDIILTGNCSVKISDVKVYLATEFEVKDLGPLRYFLGMEVGRTKSGMIISQRKYVLDLLQETGMLGCKSASTPMESVSASNLHTGKVISDVQSYQKLVGKLIYLSHTRPDICYAVSFVSQFMHSPTNIHLQAVMRILRYLKRSPGQGLFFGKHNCRDIQVYTDADWGGSKKDMRSTSGYSTFL